MRTVAPRKLLVAALSFEDRCLGALSSLVLNKEAVDVTVLEYGTDATPGREAHSLRSANLTKLRALCKQAGIDIRRISINPYAMGPLERLLRECGERYSEVLVDISCLTRPHVLAAAITLASASVTWRVGYTSPQTYGDLNAPQGHGGWQDTLLLPLGPDPSLSREGVAIGVLLVGHEVARSGIALDELEPATGIAVSTYVDDRPDLYRRALAQHDALLTHLSALRMPGPEGKKVLPYFPNGGWEREVIDLEHAVSDIARVSARVLDAAKVLNAPIVLYPFGPKVVVFCFGMLLSLSYPQASWAIYPVPRTHPLAYSDGTSKTHWFSGSELVRSLRP